MAGIKDKLQKLIEQSITSHTLTKAEGDEMLKLLAEPEEAKKLADDLGLSGIKELTALFPELLRTASNGENYLARLERKMGRGELTEKLSGAFGTLMNLTQLGVSANQISKSNKALGDLKAPGLPTAPQEDPALSNAIYEAGRGTFDASRAMAPAARQIRNNRLSDEAAALQVGGGQSGIYGALNQTASLRANRGYAELAPMMDSIRAREQARLDNLLQSRQEARQSDFRNRMSLYDNSSQNYNAELNAASQLGQSGRQNLFGALGGLADNLAVAGGSLYGKNLRFPNFKRRQQNFSPIPEVRDYNSRVDQNLIDSRSYGRNPYVPMEFEERPYGRFEPR